MKTLCTMLFALLFCLPMVSFGQTEATATANMTAPDLAPLVKKSYLQVGTYNVELTAKDGISIHEVRIDDVNKLNGMLTFSKGWPACRRAELTGGDTREDGTVILRSEGERIVRECDRVYTLRPDVDGNLAGTLTGPAGTFPVKFRPLKKN